MEHRKKVILTYALLTLTILSATSFAAYWKFGNEISGVVTAVDIELFEPLPTWTMGDTKNFTIHLTINGDNANGKSVSLFKQDNSGPWIIDGQNYTQVDTATTNSDGIAQVQYLITDIEGTTLRFRPGCEVGT